MKPRSKNERLILELRKKLPGLTEKQLEWGWQQVPPTGYFKSRKNGRGEVWCSECGTVVNDDASALECALGSGDYYCPCCGKSLGIDYSLARMKKTNITERAMVSYITTFKGWQVVRTFSFEKKCSKRHECVRSVNEVYEHWYNPATGHETIIGINYVRSFNCFKWSYGTEWSVKVHNEHCTGYYVWNDVYRLQDNYIYPAARVLPVLKRNGWTKRLIRDFDVGEIFKRLILGGDIEWLIKTKQWELLKWLLDRGQYTLPYKYSAKVAMRAGYKITDAGIWMDYLDLLSEEHKDLHNAFYVCPADLTKEHNRLAKRKQERLEQEAVRSRMKRAANSEANYERSKGMFVGIHFDDGKVYCHVLKNVQEFIEEGKNMHHCVFANEYWNPERHPESLILSATDNEGKRIETVEVDIESWTVVQSRGKYNQSTPFHDEIVDMVKAHMGVFINAEATAKQQLMKQNHGELKA